MIRKNKATSLVFPALGAVLIALCTMITVPGPVPFTMQTFAVVFVLSVLGAAQGCIAIIVYIALGTIGLPIFSGFKGGISALLGVTGGYIIGFIFIGISYLIFTKTLGDRLWVKIVAASVGMLICYTFGTAWFVTVYAKTSGGIGVLSALTMCVFPFIIPDFLKIALAMFLSEKIIPRIRFKRW